MDELVGVGFEFLAALIVGLVRSAEGAAAVDPVVFDAFEADVAFGGVEGLADGILAVGGLGAVDRAAREQRGQFRDGETVKLVLEDMVDALLPVGDAPFQADVEALGDLAQEDTRLAAGIEECCLQIASEFRRQ